MLPAPEFAALIASSATFVDALSHFGFSGRGANLRILHARIEADGLDVAHIRANRYRRRDSIALEDVLENRVALNTGSLKRRLLKAGLIHDECAICGLVAFWNGKPIVLHLDHIDGDRTNNARANLRLLCPNCHSQTETFAGRQANRGRKRPDSPPRYCLVCGDIRPEHLRSDRCRACSDNQRRKTSRPTVNDLATIVKAIGFRAAARRFGVSDNAIRKWLTARPFDPDCGDGQERPV